MRPRLVVIAGPSRDSIISLPDGEATVGRDPANAVAIIDPSVSRKHCLLRPEDGRFQIRDLSSRNGTTVNGVRIKEQWLRHGDEIATGDSVFLFLVEEEDRALSGHVEFDEHGVKKFLTSMSKLEPSNEPVPAGLRSAKPRKKRTTKKVAAEPVAAEE